MLFRLHDLRLVDNPALHECANRCAFTVPVYIYANPKSEMESLGSSQRARASEVWVREAVSSLRLQLQSEGSYLITRCIDGYCAKGIIETMSYLSKYLSVDCVDEFELYMNTRFEPKARVVDDMVASGLQSLGINVYTYNASLLYDPQAISLALTGNHWTGHWGTLMPFLNTCRKLGPPPKPLPFPPNLVLPESMKTKVLTLCEQPLVDENFHLWAEKIRNSWTITTAQAEINMKHFLVEGGLANYETQRSRVDKEDSVSRLSPYLRHGMLSPRVLFWAVENAGFTKEQKKTFGRRLFWRDLAYYQLSAFPDMSEKSIRSHYDTQEWIDNPSHLKAWQRGQTGYPMVDAAMRELYATGWIHQSMRMVVASFLIEFMGIDWRNGFRWFHDSLVDADVAINAMMWQK